MGDKPSTIYKCRKAGKIPWSGYLNFLREYKKCCNGMYPKDTLSSAAKAWTQLSFSQKEYFRNMQSQKRCPTCNCHPCSFILLIKEKKDKGKKKSKRSKSEDEKKRNKED